ncbi:MAG: BrnA antitoxin family protein [Bdellovibrionota bacterium]
MSTKNKKITYGKVEIPSNAFDPQNIKERITIMLDQDILDAYRKKAKETGDKYQSLINRTLRETLSKHPSLEKRIEALEQKIKKLG